MQDEPGILYVLTNVAMPGLVKISYTTKGSVQERIKDLGYPTGVPLPFECHFAAQVENILNKEKTLRQLFGEQRINPRKEFFGVAPEKVVLAISMGAFTEVTPGKTSFDAEEERALEKAVQSDKKESLRLTCLRLEFSQGLC
ncbi:MAG: GIY-YIG nuclease family protein [Acidobacteriaceae bacterium]